MRRLFERDVSPDFEAPDPARPGNRRRLKVFLITFLSVLLLGQAWNLLRPPEYRASARIQLTPGGNAPLTQMMPAMVAGALAEVAAPLLGALNTGAVLDEAQRLSSRPVLEKVRLRLEAIGRSPEAQDGDVTGELQRMIAVEPQPGSGIIQLTATGAKPDKLALILNTLIDVYRQEQAAAHTEKSKDDVAQAKDELARLEAKVATKRTELEAFRLRHGVLSSERDENETLARAKGLTSALNTANEKLVIAESRLSSLRAAAESGKGGVLAKDNPTLAAMEQRASQTREQLRDMERTYTGDFMAMDPQSRALRARLAELERQIAETRAGARQAAITEAEEEVDSTRATMARLREQLAADRKGAQGFLSSFSQARELENDLTQLEVVRRTAVERLAKMDASEHGLRPGLGVVELATVPLSPWQPNYLRDGLFILPAAFLLGLLAIGFVEVFNRPAPPAPGSTTFVLPSPYAPGAGNFLAEAHAAPALTQGQEVLALPGIILPRELEQHEVAALIKAGNREGRLVCAALLLGLSLEELCALRSGDVDSARLHVDGTAARDVGIPGWLAVAAHGAEAGSPLLHDARGAPLSFGDVAALVSAAAHDAGLDGAEEVTPEVLRHTAIAWLVRQGVRYSDLAGRIGRLSAEQVAAYGRLTPNTPRGPAGLEPPPMPALTATPPA